MSLERAFAPRYSAVGKGKESGMGHRMRPRDRTADDGLENYSPSLEAEKDRLSAPRSAPLRRRVIPSGQARSDAAIDRSALPVMPRLKGAVVHSHDMPLKFLENKSP